MSVRLDTLNDADRGAFEAFLHGRYHLVDQQDARRMLCVLQHVVSHNGVTSFPSRPADCVCRERGHWQNDGEALRFIIAATLTAIDERGSGHGRDIVPAVIDYEEPF